MTKKSVRSVHKGIDHVAPMPDNEGAASTSGLRRRRPRQGSSSERDPPGTDRARPDSRWRRWGPGPRSGARGRRFSRSCRGPGGVKGLDQGVRSTRPEGSRASPIPMEQGPEKHPSNRFLEQNPTPDGTGGSEKHPSGEVVSSKAPTPMEQGSEKTRPAGSSNKTPPDETSTREKRPSNRYSSKALPMEQGVQRSTRPEGSSGQGLSWKRGLTGGVGRSTPPGLRITRAGAVK